MKVCGLKLTHDGGVALLDGSHLVFLAEAEKIGNNPRYHRLRDLSEVERIVHMFGIGFEDIDLIAVDGWEGRNSSKISLIENGRELVVKGAPYVERDPSNVLSALPGRLSVGDKVRDIACYPHVSGHVAASYCTSPFALAATDCYCLVWDGAMFPRLYHISSDGVVRFRRTLFPVVGHIYALAGLYFGPYRSADRASNTTDLGVAGKLMAYIGLGHSSDAMVREFQAKFSDHFEARTTASREYRRQVKGLGIEIEDSLGEVHRFLSACAVSLQGEHDEDILAAFHEFLARLLVERLSNAMAQEEPARRQRYLCLSGGCALNIKWNSAIRKSGIFAEVWVPPFPNDSGSAIGAACCGAFGRNLRPLDWDIYSGPPLIGPDDIPDGWIARTASAREVAGLLERNELVIFLAGRAELGPRALGARSILAAATVGQNKDILNQLKRREPFRPVAPLCLEDRAADIFDPGTVDRFMLFDHVVRSAWRERIPAIVHCDGTARLQTIARTSDAPIAQVLVEYERLTGVPVLCNTSANFLGRGFFPDLASACRWGGVAHIWCDGLLVTRG